MAKRNRGIYKRKGTPFYWIMYSVDGVMNYESSKSTRFRDAELLLLQRRQEIKEGRQIVRTNHTFTELVGKYVEWVQGRQAKTSIEADSYRINRIAQYFNDKPIKQFNTHITEQFQTDLINRQLKPSTINKYLAIVRHMFTKAVDWEMVDEDTLRRVRRVKLLPVNNTRLRFLSKEECQALINACYNYLKAIVIIALYTGMRKREILLLLWENVDLNHGFILLKITKNGERREIPINETVRRVFLCLPRRLDVPYVFYNPKNGKPWGDIKRSFNTACRRAGIRDFHFHDTRHTFASHLIMSGIDLTTVKELLGHKDIKMTLRYAHLAPSHKVKAVDVLDNTLNLNQTVDQTNWENVAHHS